MHRRRRWASASSAARIADRPCPAKDTDPSRFDPSSATCRFEFFGSRAANVRRVRRSSSLPELNGDRLRRRGRAERFHGGCIARHFAGRQREGMRLDRLGVARIEQVKTAQHIADIGVEPLLVSGSARGAFMNRRRSRPPHFRSAVRATHPQKAQARANHCCRRAFSRPAPRRDPRPRHAPGPH